MAEKSSSSNRFRNFATVVYPESAPENWLDILSEQCLPCFVSPLHDLDVNPDGEVKKAHFHVLFAFEGKKSREQVQEVASLIGGVGCEVVQSLRGYARYLCHLDNPEKHQYSPEGVLAFGGLDYLSVVSLATDRRKAIAEIMDFCVDNNIVSFAEIALYARHNRYDWFCALTDNSTVFIKEFLKSRSWESDRAYLNRGSLGYNCKTPEAALVEAAEYIGEAVERSDGE